MDVDPAVQAWKQLPAQIDAAVEKLAAPAYDVRQAIAGCWTRFPVGVYLDLDADPYLDFETPIDFSDEPTLKQAIADSQLMTLAVKAALDRSPVYLGGLDQTTLKPLLIKVAYSPTARSVGEFLNFFPGKYPGGIPNAPGPVGSMLTSGLVGAGLGYGAGWVGEKLLPDRWEKGRLRNTLALIGGAAGMAPGAVWGAANRLTGRGFNDNSLLSAPAGSAPELASKISADLDPRYRQASQAYVQALADLLPAELRKAADAGAGAADMLDQPGAGIDVDALGRTLWLSGDTHTAGTAMSLLHAAGQMPGGDTPGWVTPSQMGRLAMHMGAGYVSGELVGSALGLLAGMPQDTQDALAQSGMYVGLVRSVLPHMFSTQQE